MGDDLYSDIYTNDLNNYTDYGWDWDTSAGDYYNSDAYSTPSAWSQYIAPISSSLMGLGGSLASSLINSGAAQSAADQQAAAYQQGLGLTAEQYKANQEAFAPYQQIGYQGLGQLYGNDIVFRDPSTGELVLMQGTGRPYDLFTDPLTGQTIIPPDYDTTVTNQLGNYQTSDQYQAQNTLAQEALQRQLQARGLNYGATAASAGADLSRQLVASDYGNYKNDLANRYKGLTSDYANAMSRSANQYDFLTGQVNLGLGATKTLSNLGNDYTTQATTALGNIGSAQASGTTGAATAYSNLASGLGTAAQNTYTTGVQQGWW